MHCHLIVQVIIIVVITNVFGNEKEVLKQLSISFVKPYYKCDNVMHYPNIVVSDFRNYWDGHELTRYETGCAVLCVAYELKLLDPNGQLHVPNALGFVTASGAGRHGNMVNSMSELLKTCVLSVLPKNITNICLVALEFAKCFRSGINERGWTPAVSEFMKYENASMSRH